jgi:hypothetical protein
MSDSSTGPELRLRREHFVQRRTGEFRIVKGQRDFQLALAVKRHATPSINPDLSFVKGRNCN